MKQRLNHLVNRLAYQYLVWLEIPSLPVLEKSITLGLVSAKQIEEQAYKTMARRDAWITSAAARHIEYVYSRESTRTNGQEKTR